jgi:thiamine biosynthesis lipoprotein
MSFGMKYLRIIIKGIAYLLIAFTVAGSCTSPAYRTIDGFTQGTTYHIIYSDERGVIPDSLVERILTNVDNSLSVYNKSSLISRVNNGDSVVVDSLFKDVFIKSLNIYEISDGLFDVSAAPLFNIWGFGFKNREIITKERVDSALRLTGMDKIWLRGDTIFKSDPLVSVNFNAIAQGYTADVIAMEFLKRGVKNFLIEVGGEIYCKGVNPKGREWSVGIDKPVDGNLIQGADLQDIILLKEGGLATSGNYRKFYEESGERYSHTIDPKSGYPVKHNLLSATVIASDAMTADGYATWFMVAGLERAKEIIASTPGIEGYLVYSLGEELRIYKSEGVKVKN